MAGQRHPDHVELRWEQASGDGGETGRWCEARVMREEYGTAGPGLGGTGGGDQDGSEGAVISIAHRGPLCFLVRACVQVCLYRAKRPTSIGLEFVVEVFWKTYCILREGTSHK